MTKTILITGSSTGIGYAVAKGLKDKGWRVFASCRQQMDVERLALEGLETVLLDVDSSDSIQNALDLVLSKTEGQLDALFNNAGFGQPGAVEDISRDAMRAQFETNFFGAWDLCNKVLRVMRKQGHGRIIFNSSVLGFAAMKYRGAYNASKFAMEGLCDTLRQELMGSNIFVSLVEPGPIESDFRPNALKKFEANIDVDNSFHHTAYKKQLERLKTVGHAAPFTLPASAIIRPVLHALESSSPKPRYRVTVPTHLFWYLKRILTTRRLDKILSKVA